MSLPPPPIYTPWTKGVYDVSPGMRPLGTDFGNGDLDQCLFQFDASLPRYLANKADCWRDAPGRHFLTHELSPEVEEAALKAILEMLAASYGDQWPRLGPAIPRASELQNLINHLAEDVAIVATDGDRDWLAFLHLCSPSHWAPEEKIGMSFFSVHVPVPHFERVNAAAKGLLQSAIHRGPWVRFVWSIETDDQLNHHPSLPAGRHFDSLPFMVRFERQCLVGMPTVGAALFTIRVGFLDSTFVLRNESLRESLRSSLLSMSPKSRQYKGLEPGFDALMRQFDHHV